MVNAMQILSDNFKGLMNSEIVQTMKGKCVSADITKRHGLKRRFSLKAVLQLPTHLRSSGFTHIHCDRSSPTLFRCKYMDIWKYYLYHRPLYACLYPVQFKA